MFSPNMARQLSHMPQVGVCFFSTSDYLTAGREDGSSAALGLGIGLDMWLPCAKHTRLYTLMRNHVCSKLCLFK